jgi:hypothetical protein
MARVCFLSLISLFSLFSLFTQFRLLGPVYFRNSVDNAAWVRSDWAHITI